MFQKELGLEGFVEVFLGIAISYLQNVKLL